MEWRDIFPVLRGCDVFVRGLYGGEVIDFLENPDEVIVRCEWAARYRKRQWVSVSETDIKLAKHRPVPLECTSGIISQPGHCTIYLPHMRPLSRDKIALPEPRTNTRSRVRTS